MKWIKILQLLILLTLVSILIMGVAILHIQNKLAVIEQEKRHVQDQINLQKDYIETTEQLMEEVIELQEENAELRKRMEAWLDEWEVKEKEITAYAPLDPAAEPGMCYEGDPQITYSGKKVIPYYTAAAGMELPVGTLLYVVGEGWYEVQDRGGAIGPGQIDLAVKTKKEANTFGRQNLKVVFKK